MINDKTGRAFGDHGEGHHAIEWALENLDDLYDFRGFLESWMEGDLDEYPDFYIWLNQQENEK